MPYPDDAVVQTWLDALQGLDIRIKKMFGCCCLYCDGQPVGWLSGTVLSLREVGLPGLPGELKRPSPGDKIQEIVIPLDLCTAEWLPKLVQDTAGARKVRGKEARAAAGRKKSGAGS